MTLTEENYIKAFFYLSYLDNKWHPVGTNEIAVKLHLKPASVNNMLKKLKAKDLISYEKYGKITLTGQGKDIAISIVRKHRLWETFLYEKLEFSWDEVHEVAEELEHIQSVKLIEKLDKYLNYPKYDPHGDVIPSDQGVIEEIKKIKLSELQIGSACRLISVKDNSSDLLQYFHSLGLEINRDITLISKQEFDGLTVLEFNGKPITVSKKFCDQVYVLPKN